MRIKRFEATDTVTALAMVKEELGENAIILSTRTLPSAKKNGSHRNGRPIVEVVAAMEYDQETITVPPPGDDTTIDASTFSTQNTYQHPQRRSTSEAPDRQRNTFKNSLPETTIAATRGTIPAKSVKKQSPSSSDGNDLRLRFAHFLKRQDAGKKKIEQSLMNNGTLQTEGPAAKNRPNPGEVALWRERIINKLQAKPLTAGNAKGPKVVALVGPTGVGKTTTAAKIAAWFSIHEKKRTALISMDCYRIGATDQLRTYAKIMRLPCEIAMKKSDLNIALRRHSDKDLIIIDTAGKSPYDPDHIRELTEWFAEYAIEPHLVLSATAKKEDLQHILHTYAPLSLAGLVLSKLDETRAYASICQLVAGFGLPISCLCTGQRVPEDFLLASKDFMRTLFGKGWQMALRQFQADATGKWMQ